MIVEIWSLFVIEAQILQKFDTEKKAEEIEDIYVVETYRLVSLKS